MVRYAQSKARISRVKRILTTMLPVMRIIYEADEVLELSLFGTSILTST